MLDDAGELVICGEQVALGYINRPTLNTFHFLHHPQLGRCFRTGDIVRVEEDGHLKLLGRRDSQVREDVAVVVGGGGAVVVILVVGVGVECYYRSYNLQVKLRGQRIELGEIEAVVLQHLRGCLQECCAVVHHQPTTPATAAAATTAMLVLWYTLPQSLFACHSHDEDNNNNTNNNTNNGSSSSNNNTTNSSSSNNSNSERLDKASKLMRMLIRMYCEKFLPRHMQPSRVCTYTEDAQLPQTSSGKVNRKLVSSFVR